jgi:hypothetical protein
VLPKLLDRGSCHKPQVQQPRPIVQVVQVVRFFSVSTSSHLLSRTSNDLASRRKAGGQKAAVTYVRERWWLHLTQPSYGVSPPIPTGNRHRERGGVLETESAGALHPGDAILWGKNCRAKAWPAERRRQPRYIAFRSSAVPFQPRILRAQRRTSSSYSFDAR